MNMFEIEVIRANEGDLIIGIFCLVFESLT